MAKRIACVITTYNRKQLLEECLNAVLGQSYPVEKVILIDNASTDGTTQMLREKGFLSDDKMDYHRMKKNTGGAGGFYTGIRLAAKASYDWVWIMDDDTIPCRDCLEKLVEGVGVVTEDQPVSFLASAIYGPDGEFMNVPTVSEKASPNGYPYWYQYLDHGLVMIQRATFVSILINGEAIRKCGLPNREYFIWGDDYEYTTRLTTFFGNAYLVGKSRAIHKRLNAKNLTIHNVSDPERIKMFHYHYRNNSINNRYYQTYGPVRHPVISALKDIWRNRNVLNEENGAEKLKAICRGYWEYLISYSHFRDYIDAELRQGEDA